MRSGAAAARDPAAAAASGARYPEDGGGPTSEADHFSRLWADFKGEVPRPPPPPFEPVAVRPLGARARDYALVCGAAGCVAGAAQRAAYELPVLAGGVRVGVHWACAAAAFVGLRHVLTRGEWREDREVVSGIAASAVGAGSALMRGQPRQAPHLAIGGFFGASAAHFAHRWWLRYRIAREGG